MLADCVLMYLLRKPAVIQVLKTGDCWHICLTGVSVVSMTEVCSAGTFCQRASLWSRLQLGTTKQPLPPTCWEEPSHNLQAGRRRKRNKITIFNDSVEWAADWSHSSHMSHLVPSSLQVWPLFSPLWAEGSPPLAGSHQSCVQWWRGTGETVSTFCLGLWWTPAQNQSELKPMPQQTEANKMLLAREWRCLHSEQWGACHLCPSHLGPACPGQLPAPVYCPLWWDRAARGLTLHNYKPGCPKTRFAYTITNTTNLIGTCQTACVLNQMCCCGYCSIPCSSRGGPPVSRWTGRSVWHCVCWTHWTVWQLDPARWCTQECSLWGGRTGSPIWNDDWRG